MEGVFFDADKCIPRLRLGPQPSKASEKTPSIRYANNYYKSHDYPANENTSLLACSQRENVPTFL